MYIRTHICIHTFLCMYTYIHIIDVSQLVRFCRGLYSLVLCPLTIVPHIHRLRDRWWLSAGKGIGTVWNFKLKHNLQDCFAFSGYQVPTIKMHCFTQNGALASAMKKSIRSRRRKIMIGTLIYILHFILYSITFPNYLFDVAFTTP